MHLGRFDPIVGGIKYNSFINFINFKHNRLFHCVCQLPKLEILGLKHLFPSQKQAFPPEGAVTYLTNKDYEVNYY